MSTWIQTLCLKSSRYRKLRLFYCQPCAKLDDCLLLNQYSFLCSFWAATWCAIGKISERFFVCSSLLFSVSALIKRLPSSKNLNSSAFVPENLSEKKINNSGEKTAPCVTPMMVLNGSLFRLLISVSKLQFFRKHRKRASRNCRCFEALTVVHWAKQI